MNRKENSLSVLMLPWLAHGHISPFLELAKKLSKRNFTVYLCSTPVNLSSIKDKLTREFSLPIQLVELHLPPLPELLDPCYHTTNGLPPHLMSSLKKAFDMANPRFSNILMAIKPDLLIYDFLQPWAPSVASLYNIPSVLFLTTAAASICLFFNMFENHSSEFSFSSIFLRDYEDRKMARMLESSVNGLRDVDRLFKCVEQSSNVVLIKTFREIEAKYIDHLSFVTKKKMVPIGPLVQHPIEDDGQTEFTEWLDKKDHTSAVFVSFGSEYFLSKEDMEEIAYGLELSKVGFIWVVRFPAGDNNRVEEELPEGFLERVGEKGMVVKWAAQRKILEHPSIVGFVSHCGWGSVMEAMGTGVPIIAMPMHLDQPSNARLVEEIGVGIEIKRQKNGRLNREEVAKVIREVVVEKIGEDVRRRAREMSKIIRNKGAGGDVDGAVEELLQLCGKNNWQYNERKI